MIRIVVDVCLCCRIVIVVVWNDIMIVEMVDHHPCQVISHVRNDIMIVEMVDHHPCQVISHVQHCASYRWIT
jgi:hypothetical protein